MKFFAVLILIFGLILESTITTLPLLLIVLLCFMVLLKDNSLFIAAFIFGLLLDLVLFKALGLSSAFLVTFLFLVLLYQDKFEIATNSFILVASFVGSVGFLLILGYNNSVFFESVVSCLIAVLLFIFLKRFVKIDSNSSKNI